MRCSAVQLLQKETGEDRLRSVIHTCDDWDPTYYCGESRYTLILISASEFAAYPVMPLMRDVYFFSIFLNYDASSPQSWDETVASYDDFGSRCEEGVIPLPTIVAAMGEGCVPREEVESFARQRSCRAFQYSPVTGHGLRDAFASLVERAHGTRLRYATDPDGFQAAAKANIEAMQRLFR
jgi:hypothetical protein